MKSASLAFLVLLLSSCGGGGSGDGPSGAPDVAPGQVGSIRQQWESNMITRGRALCDAGAISDLGTWEGNSWYYDGIRVYYQIADYTGDPSWNRCAGYVWEVYARYVLDNNGQIPGWRVFPRGLQLDFERTGNRDSKKAALLLASNSAFAQTGGGSDPELSRETAYLIHAYIIQEELGGGSNPLLPTSVRYALGHLDQWTSSESTSYVKPFMVGLTFEALIHYYDTGSRDPAILRAIQTAADWLWTNAWNGGSGAFQYIVCKPEALGSNPECDGPDSGPAPDLNLLIAPGFAWLYSQTGDPRYKDRADAIFQGGVLGADLADGKRFNQNYRWSMDLIRWLGN